MCFTVELSSITQRFLLAMRPGETPVPIPNTTVKTRAADGTALETVWESRRLPEFNFCTLKTAYVTSYNKTSGVGEGGTCEEQVRNSNTQPKIGRHRKNRSQKQQTGLLYTLV